MTAVWEVVGGRDHGGILVRKKQDVASPQETERLSTGSLLQQVELHGDRLKYQLIDGKGPTIGWVSTRLQGNPLVVCNHQSGLAQNYTALEVADRLRKGHRFQPVKRAGAFSARLTPQQRQAVASTQSQDATAELQRIYATKLETDGDDPPVEQHPWYDDEERDEAGFFQGDMPLEYVSEGLDGRKDGVVFIVVHKKIAIRKRPNLDGHILGVAEEGDKLMLFEWDEATGRVWRKVHFKLPRYPFRTVVAWVMTRHPELGSLVTVEFPEDPEVVKLVVCSCGNEFEGDDVFCRKCGSKRPEAAGDEPPAAAAPPASAPVAALQAATPQVDTAADAAQPATSAAAPVTPKKLPEGAPSVTPATPASASSPLSPIAVAVGNVLVVAEENLPDVLSMVEAREERIRCRKERQAKRQATNELDILKGHSPQPEANDEDSEGDTEFVGPHKDMKHVSAQELREAMGTFEKYEVTHKPFIAVRCWPELKGAIIGSAVQGQVVDTIGEDSSGMYRKVFGIFGGARGGCAVCWMNVCHPKLGILMKALDPPEESEDDAGKDSNDDEPP